MRYNLLSRRGLSWAFAALLAVAAPGAPLVHAAARLSNAALLASQLPAGKTLASASMKEVEAAIRSAAARRPGAAADLLRIAMLAKTPKRGSMPCGEVREFVSNAVGGAPDQAREISEMAQSLAPDCADAISQGTRTPVTGAVGGIASTGAAVPGSTTGETTGTNAAGTTANGDFGAGFGPGFPGSPGFSGSSPSGGFAFPGSTTPSVTSAVND